MFMLRNRHVLFSAILALSSLGVTRAGVVTGTFEDQNPGPHTFNNDFQPTNSFTTGGFTLNNNFNATFNVWSGFSVSSEVDNAFGGTKMAGIVITGPKVYAFRC